MEQTFKIHGDNIIECERILTFISRKMDNISINKRFITNAAVEVNLKFTYDGSEFEWMLVLHPGFNKTSRSRWKQNIFDVLKESGSFLDETPDAIITKVLPLEEKEEVICAIEFCSALQAGNQAWQRSGRAYSTMRTGCPYLYIVDFVKYELESTTRVRKAIRTPNPSVPYSYINNSVQENVFGAQAFIKSEEFDESNELLKDFDHTIFSEENIADYLISLMLGLDTKKIEAVILKKNKMMVDYFTSISKGKSYFNSEEWQAIYEGEKTVVELSLEKEWQFGKKAAEKSMTGNLKEFLAITKKYAYGITCKDLPFGVISKPNKVSFIKEISKFYPIKDEDINTILSDEDELIVCLIKGFKPRGDDNRPDRGLLPLLAMLTSENAKILTFIYGPMTKVRVNELRTSPEKVAKINGFWNVILGLSDYLLLDVPVINEDENEVLFRSNHEYKKKCTSLSHKNTIKSDIVSTVQNSIHEDDVDTAIHLLFTSLSSNICFEGLCNPPGGDWSGLSVVKDRTEYRWVSLPRVSGEINGKRPDHVIQLFPYEKDSIVLSIESKDRSSDLESNVGEQLKQYIHYLSTFTPSCQRVIGGDWTISSEKMTMDIKNIVSVAAFIDNGFEDYDKIAETSSCDLIFALTPQKIGWSIKIMSFMKEDTVYVRLKKLFAVSSKSIGVECIFI